MDISATQVYEDDDFTPTQQIFRPPQQEKQQIGVLNDGSNTYPIKKGINLVGRHPDCNIILNNQTVSKKHAEIEANSRGTSAWVCDLNSSNRTKLNNSILRPGRCYQLKDGNVLEFGMMRVVYKVCQSMDESLIPETPVLKCQKPKMIIPGTPDSSLNNSSTLEENMSLIADTQADNENPVFRFPSLPRKNFTGRTFIRKSGFQHSSIEDSLNSSQWSNAGRKESVGDSRISIHDLETQKSFEPHDDTNVDIYDVETQKISLSKMIKNLTKSPREQAISIHDVETQHEEDIQGRITNIHDVETQDQEDIQGRVTNIHDVETQHEDEVDIHNMKTPKKANVESSINRDGSRSVRKLDISEIKEEKKSTKERGNDVSNVETQKVDTNESTSEDTNKDQDKIENGESVTENVAKGSQDYLKLSLRTNFEDDLSELDKSRNLLGSQSLLEDFSEDDESTDEKKSKPSTVQASHVNDKSDMDEKSSEDESIFDAATQVNKIDKSAFKVETQRVESLFNASLMEDDSETDEECVFQKYLYSEGKSNEKSSKEQASDSEDSKTDEEGRVVEIALKQNEAASTSFEARSNESKELKSDAGTSKDSDDLFETLTQSVNLKRRNLASKQSADDKVEEHFDVPTQIIDREGMVDNEKINVKDTETDQVDDLAPTQVLPSTSRCFMKETSPILIGSKGISNEDDITEMEDNTPTQIISITEKASGRPNEEPSSPLNSPKANAVEECGVENIDYEMAPTQRISDIEQHLSTPNKSKNSGKRSKSLNKVNLDDTVEKNLTEMFDDINEERIEERTQISTQALESVLESSESEDKSPVKGFVENVQNNSSTNEKFKKFAGEKKGKTAITDSASNSVSNKRKDIKDTNTDSDSQNTENYFSGLTSRRKRNVLADSQELAEVEEHTSNGKAENDETKSENVNTVHDKGSNISTPALEDQSSKSESTAKVASEDPSTPRSPRKKKQKELKVAETILEETCKDGKNESEECSKNVDSQASGTSAEGERFTKISCILDDDDEDILAGLPEVRIAGTLSNPASPTSSVSSEYKINLNYNHRAPQVSVRIAPKQKEATRKSSRRMLPRKNTENYEPYRTVSKPNLSTIFGSLSNSISSNLDDDKVSLQEIDDEKTSKSSKKPAKKGTTTRSSRRCKGDNVLSEAKSIEESIDSQEQARQSPSIQSNGRTRNSSRNVDRSSVFQVEKEAMVEKAVVEPVKRNTLNVSRIGKRSLSTMDKVESNDSKKRKEDVSEGAVPVAVKSRKRNTISGRRQSANILDYMSRRSSPFSENGSSNMKLTPDQTALDKEAIIRLVKMSSCTPTGSISPSTPTEMVTENSNGNKSRQSRRTNVTNGQGVSSSLTKEIEKMIPSRRTRRSMAQRAASKVESQTVDVSSEIGEESQEIEMIMNGSLKEKDANLNVEMKKEEVDKGKSTKGAKTRGRKRENATVVHTDADSASNSSASSMLYESDNAHFEAPTSKAKRARISKNTSNVVNTTINESIEEAKPKRSTRAVRGNKKADTDYSVEESITITANQTNLDDTSETSNSKNKRQRRTDKNEADKKQKKGVIEETSSSEVNSSIETTSILSTPNRTRKTLSVSFTSSPSRTKHRILFTGISANDYSKSLIKLGASQVEDPAKCTVLVTDKVRRTVKFLCALAQSIPIVSVDWLVASEKANHFVDLENYILEDPAAEDKFGFKLEQSLEKARGHKLLEGYTVVLTPNAAPPPLSELKSIIMSCGGKPLLRRPSEWPQKSVIISREEDMSNAKKLLAKAPKTVSLQSTEFILTGILRQELEFNEFKLT